MSLSWHVIFYNFRHKFVVAPYLLQLYTSEPSVFRFYCSVFLDCCWLAMAWSMWRVTSERFEPVLSRKASESGFSVVLFGPGHVCAFSVVCNILFSLFWDTESDCIRGMLLSQTASGACSDCIRYMLKVYQVHAQTVSLSGTRSDCIRYMLRLYQVHAQTVSGKHPSLPVHVSHS